MARLGRQFPAHPFLNKFQIGVRFDAASSSGYEASLSTYNWSHTVTTGGNRILLVGVSIFATGQVTSISYGGQNLSFLRSDVSGVYRTEVWRLVAPNSGTGTITVNLSASLTSIATALSYTGVDQNEPLEADVGATGTGGTVQATVTPLTNRDIVVGFISTIATAVVAGQYSRANNTGALGSGAAEESQTINPAAATTISWTGVSALQSWAISALALRPASVTNPITLATDILGISRIKNSVTSTQTGVSRIVTTFTKTQTGLSRVANAGMTKTEIGVSRIANTGMTKTQSGVSRIVNTGMTKAQAGLSRIQVTGTKTQTGVSRIAVAVTKTQTGLSRIANTGTTKTQTGLSRIAKALTKTQTGVSQIVIGGSKTQAGISRIANTGVTKTNPGVSRIVTTVTKTQSGLSRIAKALTKTQTGLSRVAGAQTKTQTGVSKIAGGGSITGTKTQTGVSKIVLGVAPPKIILLSDGHLAYRASPFFYIRL